VSEPVVAARGLNHVGILTGDLDRVRHVLGDLLGLEVHGPEPEPELGIEVLWVMAGEVRLEFIRPTDPESRAARAIAEGQGGVHHVAVTVDDAAQALRRLRAAGVATRDELPRLGVHGSRIGFLEPGSVGGALIEVVEERHQ
jgi:methylmalonyl-CoA/ethylmalonyl-CoA epimerase